MLNESNILMNRYQLSDSSVDMHTFNAMVVMCTLGVLFFKLPLHSARNETICWFPNKSKHSADMFGTARLCQMGVFLET
jgi:hypothetical protein